MAIRQRLTAMNTYGTIWTQPNRERQSSGWLKESGIFPCEHLDVIVMTEREHSLGDEVRVRIIRVFCRNDGDHKHVAVPVERNEGG